MTVKKVKNIEWVVKDCFSDDVKFTDKYHVAFEGGLKKCVEKTLSDIKSFHNYEMFVVKDGRSIAGFFGKETIGELKSLSGFFIKTKYRTRRFFEFFWSAIKENISDEFFSSLYKINIRAIKFLSSKGKMVFENDRIITFKINLSCQ